MYIMSGITPVSNPLKQLSDSFYGTSTIGQNNGSGQVLQPDTFENFVPNTPQATPAIPSDVLESFELFTFDKGSSSLEGEMLNKQLSLQEEFIDYLEEYHERTPVGITRFFNEIAHVKGINEVFRLCLNFADTELGSLLLLDSFATYGGFKYEHFKETLIDKVHSSLSNYDQLSEFFKYKSEQRASIFSNDEIRKNDYVKRDLIIKLTKSLQNQKTSNTNNVLKWTKRNFPKRDFNIYVSTFEEAKVQKILTEYIDRSDLVQNLKQIDNFISSNQSHVTAVTILDKIRNELVELKDTYDHPASVLFFELYLLLSNIIINTQDSSLNLRTDVYNDFKELFYLGNVEYMLPTAFNDARVSFRNYKITLKFTESLKKELSIKPESTNKLENVKQLIQTFVSKLTGGEDPLSYTKRNVFMLRKNYLENVEVPVSRILPQDMLQTFDTEELAKPMSQEQQENKEIKETITTDKQQQIIEDYFKGKVSTNLETTKEATKKRFLDIVLNDPWTVEKAMVNTSIIDSYNTTQTTNKLLNLQPEEPKQVLKDFLKIIYRECRLFDMPDEFQEKAIGFYNNTIEYIEKPTTTPDQAAINVNDTAQQVIRYHTVNKTNQLLNMIKSSKSESEKEKFEKLLKEFSLDEVREFLEEEEKGTNGTLQELKTNEIIEMVENITKEELNIDLKKVPEEFRDILRSISSKGNPYLTAEEYSKELQKSFEVNFQEQFNNKDQDKVFQSHLISLSNVLDNKENIEKFVNYFNDKDTLDMLITNSVTPSGIALLTFAVNTIFKKDFNVDNFDRSTRHDYKLIVQNVSKDVEENIKNILISGHTLDNIHVVSSWEYRIRGRWGHRSRVNVIKHILQKSIGFESKQHVREYSIDFKNKFKKVLENYKNKNDLESDLKFIKTFINSNDERIPQSIKQKVTEKFNELMLYMDKSNVAFALYFFEFTRLQLLAIVARYNKHILKKPGPDIIFKEFDQEVYDLFYNNKKFMLETGLKAINHSNIFNDAKPLNPNKYLGDSFYRALDWWSKEYYSSTTVLNEYSKNLALITDSYTDSSMKDIAHRISVLEFSPFAFPQKMLDFRIEENTLVSLEQATSVALPEQYQGWVEMYKDFRDGATELVIQNKSDISDMNALIPIVASLYQKPTEEEGAVGFIRQVVESGKNLQEVVEYEDDTGSSPNFFHVDRINGYLEIGNHRLYLNGKSELIKQPIGDVRDNASELQTLPNMETYKNKKNQVLDKYNTASTETPDNALQTTVSEYTALTVEWFFDIIEIIGFTPQQLVLIAEEILSLSEENTISLDAWLGLLENFLPPKPEQTNELEFLSDSTRGEISKRIENYKNNIVHQITQVQIPQQERKKKIPELLESFGKLDSNSTIVQLKELYNITFLEEFGEPFKYVPNTGYVNINNNDYTVLNGQLYLPYIPTIDIEKLTGKSDLQKIIDNFDVDTPTIKGDNTKLPGSTSLEDRNIEDIVAMDFMNSYPEWQRQEIQGNLQKMDKRERTQYMMSMTLPLSKNGNINENNNAIETLIKAMSADEQNSFSDRISKIDAEVERILKEDDENRKDIQKFNSKMKRSQTSNVPDLSTHNTYADADYEVKNALEQHDKYIQETSEGQRNEDDEDEWTSGEDDHSSGDEGYDSPDETPTSEDNEDEEKTDVQVAEEQRDLLIEMNNTPQGRSVVESVQAKLKKIGKTAWGNFKTSARLFTFALTYTVLSEAINLDNVGKEENIGFMVTQGGTQAICVNNDTLIFPDGITAFKTEEARTNFESIAVDNHNIPEDLQKMADQIVVPNDLQKFKPNIQKIFVSTSEKALKPFSQQQQAAVLKQANYNPNSIIPFFKPINTNETLENFGITLTGDHLKVKDGNNKTVMEEENRGILQLTNDATLKKTAQQKTQSPTPAPIRSTLTKPKLKEVNKQPTPAPALAPEQKLVQEQNTFAQLPAPSQAPSPAPKQAQLPAPSPAPKQAPTPTPEPVEEKNIFERIPEPVQNLFSQRPPEATPLEPAPKTVPTNPLPDMRHGMSTDHSFQSVWQRFKKSASENKNTVANVTATVVPLAAIPLLKALKNLYKKKFKGKEPPNDVDMSEVADLKDFTVDEFIDLIEHIINELDEIYNNLDKKYKKLFKNGLEPDLFYQKRQVKEGNAIHDEMREIRRDIHNYKENLPKWIAQFQKDKLSCVNEAGKEKKKQLKEKKKKSKKSVRIKP